MTLRRASPRSLEYIPPRSARLRGKARGGDGGVREVMAERIGRDSMKKKRRIPIDELLSYWIDISKRPTLTLDDYSLSFGRMADTMTYFGELYGWYRLKHVEASADKFFQGVSWLVWNQTDLKKLAIERGHLANNEYTQMKDVAKKFIPRIKKCFGLDIVTAIDSKTPPQDAETILAYSTKLTYRWASGIIASNHLANLLIQLMSRFGSGGKQTDDIMTLYANLRNQTTNRKLKAFLVKSYRRFEDADKLRNRCAHVIEGDPTKQEIEQSIALARLLQKHAASRPTS
jgi:hypothetical protein